MCTSHHEHQDVAAALAGVTLSFRVEDMTCGHCAGTIKGAIEKSIPGTTVQADPAQKLVSVAGTTDRDQVAEIITAAGYTPDTVAA